MKKVLLRLLLFSLLLGCAAFYGCGSTGSPPNYDLHVGQKLYMEDGSDFGTIVGLADSHKFENGAVEPGALVDCGPRIPNTPPQWLPQRSAAKYVHADNPSSYGGVRVVPNQVSAPSTPTTRHTVTCRITGGTKLYISWSLTNYPLRTGVNLPNPKKLEEYPKDVMPPWEKTVVAESGWYLYVRAESSPFSKPSPNEVTIQILVDGQIVTEKSGASAYLQDYRIP